MSTFTEAPYIAALKESFLSSRCSTCFNSTLDKCPECQVMVYCNDQCRVNDSLMHKFECQAYKSNCQPYDYMERVVARMMGRVIIRLKLDGGEPEIDLCSNVPNCIRRRTWSDLLGHRDEIVESERHLKDWLRTKNEFQFLFGDQFNDLDLLEIFGKISINRFRVGIHQNLLDGRVAIGWAIYLTTSRFNHSCQPDLLQCSYDINMRLKFDDINRKIPEIPSEFDRLTVSYRHQNDFRLTNPLSYVPTRSQRRKLVSFFLFNCHCRFCADDLRNHYAESATNRLCERCHDSLIVQKSYDDQTLSLLTCLGRKKCLNTDRIIHRITIPTIDKIEQSIDIYEEKLKKIEDVLDSQSIFLLQEREKVFFSYQKLVNQCDLNEDQRIVFVHRAIQLGELLLQGYDIHLKHSAIYPKIVVTDIAALCEIVQRKDKAKELYQKAMDLWRSDYGDKIDLRDLNIKL